MKSVKRDVYGITLLIVTVLPWLSGCGAAIIKNTKWEPYQADGERIVCPMVPPMEFARRTRATHAPSTLARDMIVSTDLQVDLDHTAYIVRRRLQRFSAGSDDGLVTLAGEEIKLRLTIGGNEIALTPTEKRSYQVSQAGAWPIPHLASMDLVEFFGQGCREIEDTKP